MSDKLKEFAKDSIFYAAGDWIGKLGSLIMLPILSRIFFPSDYGLIDLLNTSYGFMLLVISLNMDTGLQKFYYLRVEKERRTLVSSTMLFRFIISSIIAGTVIISANALSVFAFNKPDYFTIIILLALVLPVEDMYSQLLLLLRLDRKAISFSAYNISYVIIQPVITYVFVVNLRLNLNGVFLARLVTISVMSALLLLHQKHYLTKNIKFREATDLMKFSLPGLPAVVQGNIMNLLPRYLLAYFSSMSVVGLFGIADRLAKTVDMFKTAFNRAWNPFAFSNAGKEDEKYLYEKVFKLFAICLLLLVITMTFFAKEIISILTPPMYHSAAVMVGGLSIYYALKALTLVYATGLYSANKVTHTSWMALIELVVFVISAMVFVPHYYAAGLIISLDISIIISFICYAITVKKYFPFYFSTRRLLIASSLALSVGGYVYYRSYLVDSPATIGQTAYKCIILLVFIPVFYLVVFTGQERVRFENAFKSFISYLSHEI